MLKYFIKNLATMLDDSSIEVAHAAVDCFHECLTTAITLYERKFNDFLKVLRKLEMKILLKFHCFSFFKQFDMRIIQ